MLRDVDLGRAHQVHVPLVEVVPGLHARESNREEHVAPESQIPSPVKNCLQTHSKLNACADTAHL